MSLKKNRRKNQVQMGKQLLLCSLKSEVSAGGLVQLLVVATYKKGIEVTYWENSSDLSNILLYFNKISCIGVQ